MRAIRLIPGLDPSHPDYPIIKQIEAALFAQAGGLARVKEDLPNLIRQAIDEVIDTPRTGRVHAHEMEKTEKTYIGTKVEILVRNYFRLPKGILDLRIAGHDVDVKNTLGQTWMIPREAIDKPCLLLASDEPRKLCYFGIFIAHPSNLTNGHNQDLKHSVSVGGFEHIHWIFKEESYPPSFWSLIGDANTRAIMRGKSGNERVEELFRLVQRRIIHRSIIQEVAQQKDYMRRSRKGGGARDKLKREGTAILSGKYHSATIKALNLPFATKEEFVSIHPATPAEEQVLKDAGQL